MTKLIIWDCDGPIVPSDSFHKMIWQHILGRGITWKFFRKMHEGNIYHSDIEDADMEILREGFKNYYTLIKDGYPSIGIQKEHKEIFRALSNKYQMVINSSGEEELIDLNLINNGIREYFEDIIYGKNASKLKTEKFAMIFKQFKVSPDECVFITDTLADLKEAQEVGIQSYAVAYPGYPGAMHDKATLTQGKHVQIVTNAQQLLTI